MAEQRGQARGELNTDDGARGPGAPPLTAAGVGESRITGQFSAVINCHDSNLSQIEVAIQNNRHEVDPHPISPGKFVLRHPVYLACFDPSKVDEDGNPAEGKPAELNMKLIREIFSTRYEHISAEPPPADGAHIAVDGMHFIGEVDHGGNPTGRVRLGNPEEVKR